MISTRSLSIAAAVALALGAGNAMALDKAATLAAQAAGRSLVVAGASAQRDAFLQLMANDLCSTAPDVYRSSTGDFRAYSCHTVSNTGAGSIGASLGIAANQDIVVFYRSEGGSAWGPYSIAQRNVQGVAFTGIKSLDVNVCDAGTTNVSFPGVTGTLPTHNCPISGTYALATDGAGVTAGLVDRPTQLGTADVEPKLFTGANSPALVAPTKFSGATTIVNNLKGLAIDTGFGQVFTLLLNNTQGSGAITNLTTEQATAIFTGTVIDWCQIDDSHANCAGAGNPITVVRREPGSGTQVGAGVQFAREGCGDAWAFVTDHDAPGAGDTDGVIEVSTTGNLESTVNNTPNSIGINVYKATVAQPNTHQISLDGVAPNRANAASLAYDYAFEATYTKAGSAELPAGSTSLAIANGLITVSKAAGRIPNNQAVFAIPSSTNLPGTVGSPSTAPVALGTRGGQSCRPFQLQ